MNMKGGGGIFSSKRPTSNQQFANVSLVEAGFSFDDRYQATNISLLPDNTFHLW